MHMLISFGRAYPGRSLLMLVSLLLAGVAEGIGLTTLLPMLSVALGENSNSGLAKQVVEALVSVGLEPTVGTMLLVIVIGMTLSSLLILLANREVGYAVAHVATDLRLALIRALMGSRWEYYLRQSTGGLANGIASEAFRAATGYEHGANVLALAVQAVVYAVIALLVSWQASAVMLLLGMVLLLALQWLVRTARRAGKKQTRLMSSLLSYLTDVLGSVKPLKAMARQDIADSLLREQNHKLNKAMQREVLSREAQKALQGPMLAILAAGGLYVALVVWHLQLSSVMVLTFLLVRVLSLLHKAQQRYHRMAAQESAYLALRETIRQAEEQAESLG
ncbi:MAG: ABC transporter transmembrane domain-containing protein, partial [Pseudomonadota bacterium]|nr:ABC transporter transmembrane domain-containing protein [Pseudomonadota bacterium]